MLLKEHKKEVCDDVMDWLKFDTLLVIEWEAFSISINVDDSALDWNVLRYT